MTTKRAIELLHRLQDEQFDGIHGDERREALEMAVRALEGDGDTISRKMAIDAINNCYCGGEDSCGEPWIYEDDAIKAVEQLPSAQPERLTDDDFETIRIHLNAYKEKLCNQHRWKEAEEYQRIIDRFMAFASAQPETHDKRTETHACDLISRQAAIDLLKQMRKDGDMIPWEGKDVFARIRKLPSAQTHWIPCSERLPEDLEEVNVAWVNHIPEPFDDVEETEEGESNETD